MNGQWLGNFYGTTSGQALLEIDDMGDFFEGVAYMYEGSPELPSTYAQFRTPDKSRSLGFSTFLYPIDPVTGDPIDQRSVSSEVWLQFISRYPDVQLPNQAEVKCEWDDHYLSVSWLTNTGTSGSARLPKSRAGDISDIEPLDIGDWEHFKSYVKDLEHYRYMFRGQDNVWRLRTPFHRSGRANLGRFEREDLPQLLRHLSGQTRHVFDLTKPLETGAFYNLVQHHGYPTPLLDWTYSPFVAAFFAYRPIKKYQEDKAPDSKKVRILIFDKDQWSANWKQMQKLTRIQPHFSILEALAIDNKRMIPQQAVSSVTNLDDIEAYIQSKETAEKKYLQVVDLPANQRQHVIDDLRKMGITAGSLFPGLDGACEELKERFF